MLRAARWKCRTQKIAKKSPSAHDHTTLSGYIFAKKARIDNRKKLLSSNISSTCPHNMVNFGLLTAEVSPVVWGTTANFNRFASWQRYCTALYGTEWLCADVPLRSYSLTARHSMASAKLCGVEQRAPNMFGRAAIRWALAQILVISRMWPTLY